MGREVGNGYPPVHPLTTACKTFAKPKASDMAQSPNKANSTNLYPPTKGS